ncbi:MAG: HDIG domain-containing protein [Bdellovibrionales bacterium]|nr:HDIG domain-containing protein [Bdellovibrionales bacterium]
MDHSRRFLEWVNTLGLEQTVFGRLVHYLDARFQIRRLSFLFLFTLLLSFLLFWDIDFPYFVQVGDIATTDIKSPISFQIVDEVATETKRREAEQSVPPIYDFDPNAYENTTHNIYKSWRKMRQLVKQTAWPEEDHKRAEAVSEFMEQKKAFETELGSPVTDLIFRWLIDKRFSASLENILIEAFAKWSSYKVYDGATNLLPEDDAPLIVRVIDRRGAFEEYTAVRGELKSLRDPQNFSFEGVPGEAGLGQPDRKRLQTLALEILAPNLTFNRQETSDRKDKARASVLPVQLSIAKNQVVVAAGAIVQPIHVTLMEEIRNLKSDRRSDFVSLVSALLFLSLMLVFFSYTRRFTLNRVRVQDKELAVMGLVTVIVVLITKIFLFMTDAAFVVKYGNLVPSSAFLYSAPIAAGPMLVGLLISSGEIIWLFTAFLAIVGAVMVDFNFGFLLVSMIGGIAAARGVYSCKKRNDIYWAGVRTGLVNSLVIALVLVMQGMGNTELLNQLIWAVPAGFMGGIISSMIAMMLVPLLESAFNFVTDVKLLELSNLNHPLMQEMIVKAPGTYHHSLVVGSMVEAAASEIGANALLAKVMAFYHDIGKTSHAQYFIENQKPGNNPHDHISPYMSKTILIAHIKDGAEMGMRHQLGKPIIDGVLQHHGTTLISYFYNKALDEADQDVDQVLEDDFRYPGPKPQFREAALVMLADSIEAAARSLDEPTTARLQNIVKNIIQAKFLDGQLNECNLTLADLSVIESSFCRILLGIYHQRIDYPNLNMSQSNPFKLRDSKPRGEKKGMSGA